MKTTHKIKSIIKLAVAATISLSATFAMAGPLYTFSVSQGTQPANVGIITLTQVDFDSVQIGVDPDPATASSTRAVRTRPLPLTLPAPER